MNAEKAVKEATDKLAMMESLYATKLTLSRIMVLASAALLVASVKDVRKYKHQLQTTKVLRTGVASLGTILTK